MNVHVAVQHTISAGSAADVAWTCWPGVQERKCVPCMLSVLWHHDIHEFLDTAYLWILCIQSHNVAPSLHNSMIFVCFYPAFERMRWPAPKKSRGHVEAMLQGFITRPTLLRLCTSWMTLVSSLIRTCHDLRCHELLTTVKVQKSCSVFIWRGSEVWNKFPKVSISNILIKFDKYIYHSINVYRVWCFHLHIYTDTPIWCVLCIWLFKHTS